MHSAVFAIVQCQSVCPSVHLSRWCIVSKRLNLPSPVFTQETQLLNSDGVIPNWGTKRGGVPEIYDFQAISYCISEMMRDKAIVTME